MLSSVINSFHFIITSLVVNIGLAINLPINLFLINSRFMIGLTCKPISELQSSSLITHSLVDSTSFFVR